MVVVQISQGTLNGAEVVSNNGFKYYEFLGVPYAKPPIGELRFKSPQSPEPWSGTRDATVSLESNTSCQLDFRSGEVTGNEDCLYLNVYIPKVDASQSQLLPVMFFIHGGGFLYGNGSKELQGPEYLVENNVVVVSINYRLGVFGFLNLGIPEASGNMGLKDQVKALEWVQNNIDKFRGDKNNVTIFGISAGSASVDYLMLSQKAKGLFHKAIQQSAASIHDWAMNYEYDHMNKILLDNLKYQGNATDKRAIYDFLLKVPMEQLVDAATFATQEYTQKSIVFGFVPTIEKDSTDAFLTKDPYKLLKDGDFNKVPVIKGFCEKEGLLMYPLKPDVLEELVSNKDFVKFFPGTFTPEDADKYNQKFAKLYANTGNNESVEDFAIDFFGDLHFTAGIWVSANLVTKFNVPTYVYEFMYDGNLNYLKKTMSVTKKGAAHGDDWTYIFTSNLVIANPDETDVLVRSRMTKMWTNFAKTGNPTANGIPINWPKFTENNKAFLKVDKELTISSNHEPDKMALFEEAYEKLYIPRGFVAAKE